MEDVCHACSDALGPVEGSITCLYCEGTYHLACTKVPISVIDDVKRMPSLHWSCIACTNAIGNPRSKVFKGTGMQVGFQAALTAAVEAMKSSLVPPVVQEIRDGFAGFAASHSASFQHCNQFPPDALPNGKRRRLFREVVASSDTMFVDSAATSNITNTNNTHRIDRPSLPPIITGTNTTSVPIPTVSQIPKTEYLWLHLSRLAASVTTEQVISMVSSQLDTPDVIAFSLLKAGTVPNSLSAITFKVRIPAVLRSKALNAASWPAGLGVREFISLPPRSLLSRTHHTNTYISLPQQSRTQYSPYALRWLPGSNDN